MNITSVKITESVVEETSLTWFENLGYSSESGPEIAFDGACPERSVKAQYSDVILEGRLRTALRDINPNIPPSAIDDAVRKIVLPESPSLIENNRRFHRMLTDGVDVSYMEDSREKFDKVWLFDLENLENND